MATGTDADISRLKDDMAALRKDLESLSDNIRILAGDGVDAGTSRARAAGDAARRKAGELGAKAEEFGQSVGHEIEARPFTSILMAFGLGMVLGKLLDR